MYKKIAFLEVYIALACVAIFNLPRYIPPSAIVVSDALDYGFNNQAAVFSTAIFILLITLVVWLLFEIKDRPVLLTPGEHGENISFRHFVYIGLIYFFCVALLYYLTGGRIGYGEMAYLFDRVRLTLANYIPYRDFTYEHGAIFLYAPAYLFNALKIFGVDLKTTCYLAYLLFCFFGLYLLFFLVNALAAGKKEKTLIFYLFSLAALPLSLGIQYTFVRFLFSYASLVFLDRFIAAGDKNKLKTTVIAVYAFVLGLLNILISPEIGAAFFVSLVFYFVLLSFFRDRKFLYPLIVLIVSGALLFFAFAKTNYFSRMIAHAAGIGAFPIIPSPSILIYLASLFYVVAVQLSNFIKYRKNIFSCALVFLSFSLMPAALGRCDPGHIFFYGSGLFLTALIMVYHISRKAFQIYALSFGIIFCVAMLESGLNYSRPAIFYYLRSKAYSMKELADTYRDFDKVLKKYKKVATPFTVSEELSDYLYLRDKYVPEYFCGLTGVGTKAEINRKIEQLKDASHYVILISRGVWDDGVANMAWGMTGKSIAELFFYPFFYDAKIRDTLKLYSGIDRYIFSNYKAVHLIDDYVVLERR
jgi:hypothetical protein